MKSRDQRLFCHFTSTITRQKWFVGIRYMQSEVARYAVPAFGFPISHQRSCANHSDLPPRPCEQISKNFAITMIEMWWWILSVRYIGNMFIQSVTRRFKKLFGGIILCYRVKKRESQSDCHLLDVWINRIKRFVAVKKAITHKNNLENIYFFADTRGKELRCSIYCGGCVGSNDKAWC